MSSRSRWRLLAILAVLVVGVMGLCLWASKPPTRREFVSKAEVFDDEYRYRFTVAPTWQCNFKHDRGRKYNLDEWTFTLPRSPIKQWIESHLLHKASPVEHTITLTCGMSGGARGITTVKGIEYIEPAVFLPEQIVSEHYYTIDNFATTLATTKLGSAHATKLVAHAPQWVTLWLDSSAEEANFTETDREVQAIIASLHFEKVTSSKR